MNEVARDIPKASGWGPLGAWNAEERMKALGPLPREPLTIWEIVWKVERGIPLLTELVEAHR